MATIVEWLSIAANAATIISVVIVGLIFRKQSDQSKSIAAAQEKQSHEIATAQERLSREIAASQKENADFIHKAALVTAQVQEARELLASHELAEHARTIGDILKFTGEKPHWKPGKESIAIRRLAFLFNDLDAAKAASYIQQEMGKGTDLKTLLLALYDYLELFDEILGHFTDFNPLGVDKSSAVIVYRGARLLVMNTPYPAKNTVNMRKFRAL